MPNARRRRNPASALDAGAVLAWYDAHARDLPWRVGPADARRGRRPDPYRVWLSEIMLQQTTVAAVRSHYARFLELWPTVAHLAAAPLDAVLVEWAGLGYYARARNLHACARTVHERFGGHFPGTLEGLLSLPGVGPYTAAAIAAIAFDAPVHVIDGNVERVMARFLALQVPVREAKDTIAAALLAAMPARPGDFAQALMDLGATICTPRQASCLLCPLQAGCLAAAGDPLAYPVKAEKAARPTRHGHAFVLLDADGDVYLRKRPPKGLLGSMSETPTSDWSGARSAPVFPADADWTRHGQVVHVFTHFRLELDVWSARVPDPAAFPEGWWAERGTLARQGLPTVFRKVLAAAGLE